MASTAFKTMDRIRRAVDYFGMVDRTFATRLKATFEENPGLTEAGLATKAGLSNSVVRKILAGTTQNPRVDTAMRICAALGVTLEDFMRGHRTPEERAILDLVDQLPLHLRRQLLGYGQALVAGKGQALEEPDEGVR